ncbi:amino acid adenylation domain-containing protein [Azospirillum soli]|uniref:amino acid adenylation domain-containing protein n=1 Tax=Azospirillum soli TaxID=1304799 RepID=UPI001AE37A1B|nr:amino acid adenylation domain-containing protein [Azospirillum soli]MBP2314304.1 amino acid adenylation domain-containing protein [Azospirillum soli]
MTGDLDLSQPPEWQYRPGQSGREGRRYPLALIYAHAAAQTPDAVALADGETVLTVGELENGARRLGTEIAGLGVAPGGRIMVLSEKRAVVPVVAGAIWKAGGVYVPVDAESPPERLAGIVGQLAPAAIVGSARALELLARERIAEGIPTLSFERVLELTRAAEEAPAFAAFSLPGEDATAYIIFTSGSSGAPKGVMISHRALLDYFYNHNQVLRFRAGSRVFSLAPFHFDVSIEDTILPLSLGAFVYQFRGLPVGPLMRAVLQRQRITHLIAVSSLLALLSGDGAQVDGAAFPDLEMVMTGAEVCDPRLIDLWVTRLPSARVINAYGPTEATIVCLTYTIAQPEPERTSPYPIGHPLPGVSILLLDGQDRPITAPGEPGELLVGGTQVMTGYLNRPEDTARVCPVIDGVRYYRTGDICRFDERGRVEFMERADDMVKIGGRRIHLGEIRHLALALPGVLRAAVGLVKAGERQLIGLTVVCQHEDAEPAVTADAVRTHLARHLPAYMMPAVLGVVCETPLTASGKTDERALIARLAEAAKSGGPGDYHLTSDVFTPLTEAVR